MLIPQIKFTAGATFLLLSTCIPQVASSADTLPILGFWSMQGQGCGDNSYFEIKKSGASGPEELCELISATRKGHRFTLKQRCDTEGVSSVTTLVVRRISPKIIEVHGQRYRKCKPNWQ
ncbi:MAG: hypothetical protein KL863_05880 [Rhizobium sp.]|nr:hypothetical protein [Rhizobium sp.]